MKKYQNIIIAAAAVILLLAAAFFLGGGNKNVPLNDAAESLSSAENGKILSNENENLKNDNEKTDEKIGGENGKNAENNTNSDKTYTKASEKETDKYQTEPVPEGVPEPVEPQNADITKNKLTCTISVRCDTILNNMDKLDKNKTDIIPENGIILAEKSAVFYEGESVFNLLSREMKKNKIHLEFVNTPVYNSAYIEGIANIYEFDCGNLSGWMYRVNGKFPNYGCSRYKLSDGDKVEWVYTCDLGRDVGDESYGGGQKE